MTLLTFESLPLPLRLDADGVARVGETRVTLDTVVSSFKHGATAEQIVQDYPVLKLGDVYAVIAYYLSEREPVDEYLAEQRKESESLSAQLKTRYNSQGLRQRLLNRLQVSNPDNAASSGR